MAVTDDLVTLKRLEDGEEFAFPKNGAAARDYGNQKLYPDHRKVDLPKAAEFDPKFPDEGYMNMTDLHKLNDAELDRNLKIYHEKNHPYCYCGNTLVALNLRTQFTDPKTGKKDPAPYGVDTSSLYNEGDNPEAMLKYAGKGVDDHDVDPHLYAIADQCYHWTFEPKAGEPPNPRIDPRGGNQAMVITGESGAGKSYNTKVALRYLAFVGRNEDAAPAEDADGNPKPPVTDRMVKCNDILEAFGNASMPRNPDSSRFGKLFQIYFDRQEKFIKGCDITTYLLEKSRITAQVTITPPAAHFQL